MSAKSGIGDILGLTIALETGDIGRFAGVGKYASYCRCVGSEWRSNGAGRLVSTLEGGYDMQALASRAAAHVKALMVA